MQALKLTFVSPEPIIVGHYLTLDTVLAKALYRATGSKERAVSEVPLTQTQGVYHGSSIRFMTPVRTVTIDFVKGLRGDLRDLNAAFFNPDGKKHKRFDNKRGDYRAEMDAYTAIESASNVVFYAHGDEKAIRELEPYFDGLGKKHNQGIGGFDQLIIDKVDEDYALFHSDLGVMRPIPKDVFHSLNLHDDPTAANLACWDKVTYQPPYWDLSKQADCYVPYSLYMPPTASLPDMDDDEF